MTPREDAEARWRVAVEALDAIPNAGIGGEEWERLVSARDAAYSDYMRAVDAGLDIWPG